MPVSPFSDIFIAASFIVHFGDIFVAIISPFVIPSFRHVVSLRVGARGVGGDHLSRFAGAPLSFTLRRARSPSRPAYPRHIA